MDTMIDNTKLGSIGSKGLNLMRLFQAGENVPEFVVLGRDVFMSCLSQKEREDWDGLSSTERMDLVRDLSLREHVLQSVSAPAAERASTSALETVLRKLNKVPHSKLGVAVRSSAADEDGACLSYAGQFKSILNVERNGLADAVKQVWQSGFTAQILEYRMLNGITAPLEPPCVIIQRMVDAKLAGVAFGANPITGELNEVTISSVDGLADKLVSGEVDGATYSLKDRAIASRLNESNGRLTDKQIFAIGALVKRAEAIFNGPQDIEWVIDQNDELFIVQSRPITTLKKNRLDIFDNSNIGESYPGITTPLTFSFARKAYQHVYETFCRMMGVPKSVIETNSYIFPQMLGLVRGRIYYNLLNWYRLLSLFPGFKTNRRFMEQMMGVKATLPAEFLNEFDRKLTARERALDALTVSFAIAKLIFQWVQLPKNIHAFNSRVEKSLQQLPKDLSDTSTDEIAKLYRSMEQDLLLHWDAPIVNDFFAMVSFGVLRSVCAKWFPSHDGLRNQLLCGETGIVSTQPVTRMKQLAAIARTEPALLAALRGDELKRDELNNDELNGGELTREELNLVRREINKVPRFAKLYRMYIDRFGDRCTGELKLESETLIDNPRGFHMAIARMAEPDSHSVTAQLAERNKAAAQLVVKDGLKHSPLRALVFHLILRQTAARIRERENLRFERTRVFGAVRKMFVEIGRRFEKQKVLDSASDIFYLETEEVLRFIEGTSTSGELKSLVHARKREFESFRQMPAPPDRFTVRGGLLLNGHSSLETYRDESEVRGAPPAKSFELKGLGCCPGTVSGFARIIEDPSNQTLSKGELLVAKRTDPGWITVIAQARGIVVEYGSLLSHTAIVARELGIPTIVSVSNVTTTVQTGDWLNIDGATGELKVTPPHADEILLESTDLDCEPVLSEPGYLDGELVPNESEDINCELVAPMKSEVQNQAGFSFVRYAQCWEDTDIVIEAMNVKPGDVCVSIASAGDNTLALLARNPSKVYALDLNPAQLALMELKAAAFKLLTYDEMLVVLGYRDGSNRRFLYENLASSLSPAARSYWNSKLDDIECGVVSTGKFERYFEIFRKFSLPFTHSRRTVDALLLPKSREERERFFNRKWNTFRWRALVKVFFSELVMGSLGRDPRFFAYAENGLPEAVMAWTRKALVDQDPSKNPYLHWILKGKFGSELPAFLREENFERIKMNINKLELRQVSLEEFLSEIPQAHIDSMNLSDVFEYVSEDNYKSIMKLIARACKPGTRVVYWNMMARRTSEHSKLQEFKPMTELSEQLFEANKTFFYSKFVVEEVDREYGLELHALQNANRSAVQGSSIPPDKDIQGRAA